MPAPTKEEESRYKINAHARQWSRIVLDGKYPQMLPEEVNRVISEDEFLDFIDKCADFGILQRPDGFWEADDSFFS